MIPKTMHENVFLEAGGKLVRVADIEAREPYGGLDENGNGEVGALFKLAGGNQVLLTTRFFVFNRRKSRPFLDNLKAAYDAARAEALSGRPPDGIVTYGIGDRSDSVTRTVKPVTATAA